MKKYIYILICTIWMSCANESKNTNYEMADYDIEEDMSSNKILDSKNFNYQSIASQKLLEYFDLIRLKEEHPEFKDDVLLQLKNFSHDSLNFMDYPNLKYIENIKPVGEIIKISDSVKKMKLHYTIVSDKTTKTDSIYAIITTKQIILENKSTSSTKVTFLKQNN